MNQALINVPMMHAHRNNPTQQQNTMNTMIAIVPIIKFIFSIIHSIHPNNSLNSSMLYSS